MSIPWLANKYVDPNALYTMLDETIKRNHYSNSGPAVLKLEQFFAHLLSVPHNKVVVATCNATCALHGLISAIKLCKEKEYKWATQSFTFPSSAQGPLANNVEIVDVDIKTGTLDLNQLSSDVDAIVVTNPFGNIGPLSYYEEWQKDKDRVVIFDNAATPLGFFEDRSIMSYGDGSIVSLHHTKPIGFGEGGLAIMDKCYEPYFRQIINFGYDVIKKDLKWRPEGGNYKMSDIAAAFCQCYLDDGNIDKIHKTHTELYRCWSVQMKDRTDVSLFPNLGERNLPSCISIILSKPIPLNDELSSLGARKYYKPLIEENCPNSVYLYDHVICVPCHSDITSEQLQRQYEAILSFIDDP